MTELTVWSLPKALLAAVPETAPVLAALAADAFELDDDDLAEVEDASPEGSGSRLDRINAILGMNLHAEFGAYRVLGAVLDEVLLKAVDTGNGDLAGRSSEFLEAVLGSGDEHLRTAVATMVLENSQWTDERWAALHDIAGPLLRDQMDQRPRP
jgi:hypothetical protein